MISRVSIGLLLTVVVATSAQRRPPNYSQDRMPATSFSCRDKIIGGYYADPETDCQMFHVCVKVPGQGVQDYKFLCPNDTSFDQENQICDDWFNVDCEASTLFYSDNFDLYRIGSDFPSSNQSPRLPSNNINNAVSENDDDFYLQKSDRGENVGSDLLRGSHSSNFYANKNRGREDDDEVKDDYKKKNNKNNVKKLLTGKRPISSTQAPIENYSAASAQYQPRTHNNNYSGRVSQFRGHVRSQQTSTSTEATAAPSRQTETYNRGQPFQRNYYSPTTAKAETTSTPRTSEYFRNYSPTTKQNYYENTQNYNAQTTAFAQTTRNYYNPRVTTTTTIQPSTVNYETTTNSERNNYYETQKLYKINTGGAFNQYDEPKDEFLKTAPSQNLGASAFNSLQNSLKTYNASVSSSYNFNAAQKPASNNYQAQTYFPTSTQAPNYYTTTLKPFQQNNYYTTPQVQSTPQAHQQNYYNPIQTSSTAKPAPQYSPTTIRPYQHTFTQATQTTYQQYNPTTTLKTFQQQQYNPTTIKPFQQQYNPTTVKPFQQQQQYNPTTVKPFQQQQYNPTTAKPFQQQQYNTQQNYQTATAVQPQQTTNFQSARNTAAPQTYQQPQNNPQHFQNQRNPSQYQTSTYYNPTTQRAYQTTVIAKSKIVDATEQPRPFTQESKKSDKNEKEQYDYAYYDDGTQSEYDSIEPLEEFKRTKSKI